MERTALDADTFTIETIIDARGLADTISILVDICYGKGQHLTENWQDKRSADLWNDAGELLSKIAGRATITRVS